MRRFIRILAILLLVSFAVLMLFPVRGAALPVSAASPPQPSTAPPKTSAASAALFDATSGTFLALQNGDERRPMASTTKIMTALVVLEQASLDDTVTVPPQAVGVEGSSIYLFAGEQITVRTLLYALLLSSANDAAVALACHTAGSVSAFAALMNERAATLGLTDTHFQNPHGLHDEAHYTTARELAIITATALQNSTFAAIVATKRYSAPQIGTDATRLFLNHNRLLRTYEDAVGVKTGFTKKSGRCLVSAAAREGLLLVAVTLNDPDDWRDHKALFDWGFAEFEGFVPELPALSLPVVGGTRQEVALIPVGQVSLTLPKIHGEITCVQEAPRFLFAGFAADKTVGRLLFYMDGEVIATLPLKTAEGVARAWQHRGFFAKIKDFFKR